MPQSGHCHVKDSMVHWINDRTYHRYNIVTGEQLEPIDLPVRGHLLSVTDKELEVGLCDGIDPAVYTITLSPLGISDRRMIVPRGRYVDIHDSVTPSILGISTQGRHTILHIHPYTRYERSHSIKKPKDARLIDTFFCGTTIVTLWLKNGTYHLLEQDEMMDTGIPSNFSHGFLLYDGNFVILSPQGVYVNGEQIDTLCCSPMELISQDHFMNKETRTIYRIKQQRDIMIKSCTKRT